MKFMSLAISSLLIGLFVFGLFYIANTFSSENSTNTSIMKDTAISKAFGNISQRLNDSESDIWEQQQGFINESSSKSATTSEGFSLRSILSSGIVFMDVAINMLKIIADMVYETLDVHPVVLTMILAILGIAVILAIWRVIKYGE